MQITPPALDAIFYAFGKQFQAGYDQAMPFWMRMATRIPSTTGENRYAWMAKLPRMREWVGDRVVQNLAAQIGRAHV